MTRRTASYPVEDAAVAGISPSTIASLTTAFQTWSDANDAGSTFSLPPVQSVVTAMGASLSTASVTGIASDARAIWQTSSLGPLPLIALIAGLITARS